MHSKLVKKKNNTNSWFVLEFSPIILIAEISREAQMDCQIGRPLAFLTYSLQDKKLAISDSIKKKNACMY